MRRETSPSTTNRADPMAPRPLRRFTKPRGEPLTIGCIRGPWRPSGAVGGVGVFAVIWSTYSSDFWAALRDFAPSDQLLLIELGRRQDAEQFGGGYGAR